LSEPEEVFVIAEQRSSEVEECFEEVKAFILERLPSAEVEHVGSTAVPGCAGKGDVDVAIRVSADEFESVCRTLDECLCRSRRNDATDSYVEYDYLRQESVASVHLVGKGGSHDAAFHQFKAMLLSDPALVDAYNSLKREWDGRDMEGYRAAKARFIESLLG
jgi:GrpB-like predicted nucleotidyltransferase (UPF0157 family)